MFRAMLARVRTMDADEIILYFWSPTALLLIIPGIFIREVAAQQAFGKLMFGWLVFTPLLYLIVCLVRRGPVKTAS
ncbi:hypothetical protein HYS28_01430 [Candidatus Uhrbacteria bacterium]|nr:hypothetical protein [Candidatus Uhrbacteria bacterium]